MRILVTGREGQVAQSLIERSADQSDIEVFAVGRPTLDLEFPYSVFEAVSAAEPDLVVSAAAYTSVDQAEDEPEKAFAVNALGAEAVAAAAAAIDVPVIHISTDYVFAGSSDQAYVESDPTGPQSVYGKTKLEGERLVARANPKHLIVRTAWLYSPFSKNFVKTMLHLARAREEVSVVADQTGNPTSALDLADAILHVSGLLRFSPDFDEYGIYHVAGTGETNWSGFARHVFEASAAIGGPTAKVLDIATSEFPTKAVRPANSRLSSRRFSDAVNWQMPDWRISTTEVVRRLVA